MNRSECKKYIRKAYKRIINSNKTLNEVNIEYEMRNILNEQIEVYVAYYKIAVHNMKNSGNIEVTLKDILSQIEILQTIYPKYDAINISKKL